MVSRVSSDEWGGVAYTLVNLTRMILRSTTRAVYDIYKISVRSCCTQTKRMSIRRKQPFDYEYSPYIRENNIPHTPSLLPVLFAVNPITHNQIDPPLFCGTRGQSTMVNGIFWGASTTKVRVGCKRVMRVTRTITYAPCVMPAWPFFFDIVLVVSKPSSQGVWPRCEDTVIPYAR